MCKRSGVQVLLRSLAGLLVQAASPATSTPVSFFSDDNNINVAYPMDMQDGGDALTDFRTLESFRRPYLIFPGGAPAPQDPPRRRTERSSTHPSFIVGSGVCLRTRQRTGSDQERPNRQRSPDPTTNAQSNDLGVSGGAGAPSGLIGYGPIWEYYFRGM